MQSDANVLFLAEILFLKTWVLISGSLAIEKLTSCYWSDFSCHRDTDTQSYEKTNTEQL